MTTWVVRHGWSGPLLTVVPNVTWASVPTAALYQNSEKMTDSLTGVTLWLGLACTVCGLYTLDDEFSADEQLAETVVSDADVLVRVIQLSSHDPASHSQ